MDEVFQTPPFSGLSLFLLWSSLIEVGKSVCGVCNDSDDCGIRARSLPSQLHELAPVLTCLGVSVTKMALDSELELILPPGPCNDTRKNTRNSTHTRPHETKE